MFTYKWLKNVNVKYIESNISKTLCTSDGKIASSTNFKVRVRKIVY